jgi:hypothetical protein
VHLIDLKEEFHAPPRVVQLVQLHFPGIALLRHCLQTLRLPLDLTTVHSVSQPVTKRNDPWGTPQARFTFAASSLFHLSNDARSRSEMSIWALS